MPQSKNIPHSKPTLFLSFLSSKICLLHDNSWKSHLCQNYDGLILLTIPNKRTIYQYNFMFSRRVSDDSNNWADLGEEKVHLKRRSTLYSLPCNPFLRKWGTWPFLLFPCRTGNLVFQIYLVTAVSGFSHCSHHTLCIINNIIKQRHSVQDLKESPFVQCLLIP